MKLTLNRIIIAVAIGAFGAFIFFITGIFLPPFRSFSRVNEKLPAVILENANTVYCRMSFCDFRFPLPEKAHLVRFEITHGGADTIDGLVYVASKNGGPVNLRSYAEYLQGKHFVVNPTDGSGCAGVTNKMPDIPFVSGGKVIHYPLFEDFFAGSKNQVGGTLQVQTQSNMTQIHFSYFGDY